MTSQVPIISPPKRHLSHEEQLERLKSRGLLVADDEKALKTLRKISYYRLSGYWYPYRKTNPVGTPGRQNLFSADTSLELIEQLYEFDRELRLLVLDAVERIEVILRSDIAHYLGKRNVYAHDCPNELDGNFTSKITDEVTGYTSYNDWRERVQKAVSRASEDFVDHHNIKYGGKMPIWVISELWDFGQLSKFYQGMKYKDKTHIAKKYCITLDANTMTSWLRTISLLRNVSAHHSRLWNRNITSIPSITSSLNINFLNHIANDDHAKSRAYGSLCILQLFLRWISPTDSWHVKLISLCEKFPVHELVTLKDAGFPEDWKDKHLWK